MTVQIFKCKDEKRLKDLLTPHLETLEGEGFLTRPLAKPIGRHRYLSDYRPYPLEDGSLYHPLFKLFESKEAFTLVLVSEKDELVGIGVGAPMVRPFGRSWKDLSLFRLAKEPVKALPLQASNLYHLYSKCLSNPKFHNPHPLSMPKDLPYELLLLGSSLSSSRYKGHDVLKCLLDEAAKEGFTFVLGEASGATTVGSIRLMKKIYLNWEFFPYFLKDLNSKAPLEGPCGDYFLVGKPIPKPNEGEVPKDEAELGSGSGPKEVAREPSSHPPTPES